MHFSDLGVTRSDFSELFGSVMSSSLYRAARMKAQQKSRSPAWRPVVRIASKPHTLLLMLITASLACGPMATRPESDADRASADFLQGSRADKRKGRR
ncbi:hypothetical protein CHELA1G11_14643 [Hyphomicrobiales bacterium]|nr:hypothetical protein CHELA1G2_14464 [Hyphomicrobiales bacterium]CAH1680026.1 hypothetical protein CHELA1G11_14643 [Hyphomicrobiales bacterium]